LTAIATRAKPPNASFEQTMVGVYRANPHAFTPDEHRLKTGVMLKIPPQEELASIDQNEAAELVRKASAAWRAQHGAAR
jgi:pilus assembly protein FimV